MKIFVFVRQGCCLCDSLKNKLAKINLNELFPNLEELKEIDIDRSIYIKINIKNMIMKYLLLLLKELGPRRS